MIGPLGRLLATAVLGAAAAGCAAPPARGKVAAVTIAPLADVVARLAGGGWDVRTIVPPGVSPHVFEPTPKHVRAFSEASLVVTVGAGYDDWVRRCATAAASHALIHDAGATVGITAEAGEAEHAHGHAHGEADLLHDPHWWLSPPLVAKALGPLAERLSSLDPAGRDGYVARARALAAALEGLDAELAAGLAAVRHRPFLTAHNAWAHMAERYGLVVAGAIEPVPGRDPSPRDLLRLLQMARERHLNAIFAEPQFPEAAARVIASDAGLTLHTLDPFGGVPGRLGYEEMMRFNARSLVAGLGS